MKENRTEQSLSRRVTRREALKAGGLTALGLVFTTPRIDTIRPMPLSESVSPVAPPPEPAQQCTAFIDEQNSGIVGPGAGGASLASGSTNICNVQLVYGCGQCSGGNCNSSIQYQWSADSTGSLDVQIASPNSPSTEVITTIDLSGGGFGIAQYTLHVAITLTCGSGSCQSVAQAVLSTTINVFA